MLACLDPSSEASRDRETSFSTYPELLLLPCSHLRSGRLLLLGLLGRLRHWLHLLLLLSLQVLEEVESLSYFLVEICHICEKSCEIDNALVKQHTGDLTGEIASGALDAIVDSVTHKVSAFVGVSHGGELAWVGVSQLNRSEWCLKLWLLLLWLLHHWGGLRLTLHLRSGGHCHGHLLHVLVSASLVRNSATSSTLVVTSLLIHEVVCALVHLIHWNLLSTSTKVLPI